MGKKADLKKWILSEYPSLNEEEVVEMQADLIKLIDWWVSVSVEVALTEMQNDDTVKK